MVSILISFLLANCLFNWYYFPPKFSSSDYIFLQSVFISENMHYAESKENLKTYSISRENHKKWLFFPEKW